jgi:hypothetical protein
MDFTSGTPAKVSNSFSSFNLRIEQGTAAVTRAGARARGRPGAAEGQGLTRGGGGESDLFL